jgi:hypothetical protein
MGSLCRSVNSLYTRCNSWYETRPASPCITDDLHGEIQTKESAPYEGSGEWLWARFRWPAVYLGRQTPGSGYVTHSWSFGLNVGWSVRRAVQTAVHAARLPPGHVNCGPQYTFCLQAYRLSSFVPTLSNFFISFILSLFLSLSSALTLTPCFVLSRQESVTKQTGNNKNKQRVSVSDGRLVVQNFLLFW